MKLNLKQWPLSDGDFYYSRCLLLRVRNGLASWVFRYTSPSGKRREMGLGTCPIGSPDAVTASAETAELLAVAARRLLAEGADPIDHRNAVKSEAKATALRSKNFNVRRLLRMYHEKCVEPKVSTKYARQWTVQVEADCPSWLLDIPVIDVRAVDVLSALHGIPTVKRRDLLRQRIDQAMEWLISSESAHANPAGVRRNTRPKWVERFAA